MSTLQFIDRPVYQLGNVLLMKGGDLPPEIETHVRIPVGVEAGIVALALSPNDFIEVTGVMWITWLKEKAYATLLFLNEADVLVNMFNVLIPIFGERFMVAADSLDERLMAIAIRAGMTDVDTLHGTVTYKHNLTCAGIRLTQTNAMRAMTGRPCELTVVIDTSTQKILRDLKNLPIEMSGDLPVMLYEDDPKGLKEAVGICVFDSSSVESGTPDFVAAPTGIISFHTHPKATTEKYSTFAAWPSSVDMSNLLFMKNLLHIVIADEGIWTLSRTAGLQQISRILTDEQKQKLVQTSAINFSFLDDLRTDRTAREQIQSINSLKMVLSRYAIEGLLSDSGIVPSAFVLNEWLTDTLYNFGFIPWGGEMRIDIKYIIEGGEFFDVYPKIMTIKRQGHLQKIFDSITRHIRENVMES
ncbi:hypothetical protein [Singapore grouper iridovirus]|nr:hypothetical protein [Singapore grouper iridovirus]